MTVTLAKSVTAAIALIDGRAGSLDEAAGTTAELGREFSRVSALLECRLQEGVEGRGQQSSS